MEVERRSLAQAKRVVVIGGGNVGMETAGDVFDTFPNKELIIVVRSTLFRKSGPAAGSHINSIALCHHASPAAAINSRPRAEEAMGKPWSARY